MHTNNDKISAKESLALAKSTKQRKPYNQQEKQEKANKAKRIDKRQLLVL